MGQRKGWAQATRAPTEPSLVVEMLCKEIHTFDSQLGRMSGDPRKTRTSGARRNFSMSGALAGILRIAFKALFEYVREVTFSSFGLQQLQLDAELFEEVSRDFVEAEDAGMLGSLLGEAVNSASQRCEEPTLLDPTILEALVSQKKKMLRFD